MCGIAGIANFYKPIIEEEKRLAQSLKNLSHRGPDFSGVYSSTNVLLGHTRLSIIDTSCQANQPFIDETKNYIIVFNGEIYNFKEIRAQLQQKGYQFSTNSDTEVLLKLYIEKGIDCLWQINGDFAFAIYDKIKQTLIIARDRFGVKPLYFTHVNHTLYFSSELKGLLPLLDFTPEISNEAFLFYLQLNYIPAPLSIFKNIKKLLPGNFIVFNQKELCIQAFYNLPQKINQQINETTAIETFKNLLIQSVEKRLIADVPIGCFLSGGLDSSIICAIAKQFKPNIETFTIGFKNNHFYDESNDAEIVAKYLQTKHHTIHINENELLQLVPSILEHIDEPFADSSAIAVSALTKYTRQHITVALSGDGADELHGGYYKHTAHHFAFKLYPWRLAFYPIHFLLCLFPESRENSLNNKFRQLKKFTYGLQLSHSQRYWYWATTMQNKHIKQLLLHHYNLPDFYFLLLTKALSIHQVLLNDIQLVLPNDMLYKTDSMSMMHSLEVRVPMIDHEVVNFVASLPEQYKIHFNNRKILLKKAFGHLLPVNILNKPKHGFEVPLNRWLHEPLLPLLHSLTDKKLIENQQIFKYQYIQHLIKKNLSVNPSDSAIRLWNILVFQYWWKKTYH